MGHEVVHALARHGGERMSQNTLAQTTLQAIGIALGVSGANPVLSQAGMAALGVARRSACYSRSAGSTSRKQTMWASCWRQMPDMTPERRSNCGREWASFPAENPRRSLCPHTRVTKPEFNSLREWMGRRCRFTSPSHQRPTTSCRCFISRDGARLESLLTGPYTFLARWGDTVLARRACSTGGKSDQGQGRWITSRRSDPTPAPQKTNRRWPRERLRSPIGSGKGETAGKSPPR